jgi:hypothetical protein
MRLRLLFLPRAILLLLLIGGGGFLLIGLFGESQVVGFSLGDPNLQPIEAIIKDRLSGRYSAIACGWAVSTVALFWSYMGRQLRKVERMPREGSVRSPGFSRRVVFG